MKLFILCVVLRKKKLLTGCFSCDNLILTSERRRWDIISGYELIFFILVSASLFDLSQYRVPNALCGAALLLSLFRRFEVQGLVGTLPWFAGIFIPFILCYVLYHCHMLGAGDSKLFSVIGSFVGISLLVQIMIGSLCIGAAMSIMKLITCHNATRRFQRVFQYLADSMQNHRCKPYYDIKQEGEDGIIPFTIPISLATLWCIYC